jgi:hypothetical protein
MARPEIAKTKCAMAKVRDGQRVATKSKILPTCFMMSSLSTKKLSGRFLSTHSWTIPVNTSLLLSVASWTNALASLLTSAWVRSQSMRKGTRSSGGEDLGIGLIRDTCGNSTAVLSARICSSVNQARGGIQHVFSLPRSYQISITQPHSFARPSSSRKENFM